MTTETIPARVDARYQGGMSAAQTVDVRALREALERVVEGEVRFDSGSKAMYATDASNYRQVPLGVVIPKTLEDVVATHRACHEFGAPVLPRGGGTSLSGETVNFAVVLLEQPANDHGIPIAALAAVGAAALGGSAALLRNQHRGKRVTALARR